VETNLSLKRKATLLLTEVLKLAQHSLPESISASLQVLPALLPPAIRYEADNHEVSTSTIYQIESINRILARSGGLSDTPGRYAVGDEDISASLLSGEPAKDRLNPAMDETQFRNLVLETQVLNTVNYVKWKWDLILRIIEGPLTNPKRLEEAIKGSKFMKRLVGFYRPFKYRFSMIPNTKPNQRYVRTGCTLLRILIQSPEGTKYLAENKLLRQIAECLAQVDRMSGLTSSSPLFSREQMSNTLSGGYFALLGVLSSDPNGLAMMERWHMLNMFYHIIELNDRSDLVQALLGNMDFSRESHLRVLLSKALTAGPKDIRLFATKLLRKYAVGSHLSSNNAGIGNVDWVVKLLVTQLYDPDVAVCEVAVKILEEACNQRDYLEYVVKCRPSLDHLGEIGAPLLLRFLSTSVGYHYLDGLDYITQEMDDWFLGRNDAYVALVEASLSRAYVDHPRRSSFGPEDMVDLQDIGIVPPHFYRELARTSEGCKLLEQSGHFNEFSSTIRDFRLDEEDPEALLKVKGCLWAVGNVGSMELGAPFLEETEVVQDIVQIAERAQVITMRGTAFFVLGLISRSQHGLEMLLEAGWDAAIDQRGESRGLCLPRDLSRLYYVRLVLLPRRISLTVVDL
jgi:rapamycin-insensitive companion of mTOR